MHLLLRFAKVLSQVILLLQVDLTQLRDRAGRLLVLGVEEGATELLLLSGKFFVSSARGPHSRRCLGLNRDALVVMMVVIDGSDVVVVGGLGGRVLLVQLLLGGGAHLMRTGVLLILQMFYSNMLGGKWGAADTYTCVGCSLGLFESLLASRCCLYAFTSQH